MQAIVGIERVRFVGHITENAGGTKVAGVSACSFYHRFESKDELLSYYFVAGYEKYRKQFDAISSDDVIKNITDAYDLYIAFCQEQSLGFMKVFYTPMNKSLRVNLTPDGSITHVIPVVVKRCIFDWCLNDGGIDVLEPARRVLTRQLNNVVPDKY